MKEQLKTIRKVLDPLPATVDTYEAAAVLYELEKTHYPLPGDLYPDSKDWKAGDYFERVQWLHKMYEGQKALVAEYEKQLDQQAATLTKTRYALAMLADLSEPWKEELFDGVMGIENARLRDDLENTTYLADIRNIRATNPMEDTE